MTEKFKVEFLKEVFDFLDSLDEKARKKILFKIDFGYLGISDFVQQKTIPTFCILGQNRQ